MRGFMKIKFLFFMVFFITNIFLVSSCSSGDPESISKKFLLDYYKKNDLILLREYLSEGMNSLLDESNSKGASRGKRMLRSANATALSWELRSLDFSNKECIDKKCKVTFYLVGLFNGSERKEKKVVSMVKESGLWKVSELR